MTQPSPQHMTIEKWFFLLLTAGVVYLFWQTVEPFIFVILIAGVTAIILAPLESRLRKHLKRKHLSAGVLTIAVLFLVFIPLLIIGYLIVIQASELIQSGTSSTSWLNDLRDYVNPLLATLPPILQEQIQAIRLSEIVNSLGSWVFNNIGDVFASTAALILNAFIFFAALYYLLLDRTKAYNEALTLSPLDDKTDAKLLKRIVKTVRSVVFGILMLAIIQGILAGIGMTIFGVPGSILWGALTIVAAMVPIVGTGLVLIPAVLYLFITGSTAAGIGLLIWGIVFVSLSDNFIGPYLIGGATKMHNFFVLIVVLGGLHAFGPVGGIAGPIILAGLLALLELYKSGILSTGELQEA